MATVFDDFAWLIEMLPEKLESMPHPNDDLAAWIQLVRCSSWITLLKKAVSSSMRLRNEERHPSPPAPSHMDVLDQERSHFCYECGRSFNTHIDMLNHAHRAHDYISPARRYSPDNVCLCCLTLYGSRHAVVQHLQYSKKCLRTLQDVYSPLSYAYVRKQDAASRSSGHNVRPLQPAKKLHGPHISTEMSTDGLRLLVLNDA